MSRSFAAVMAVVVLGLVSTEAAEPSDTVDRFVASGGKVRRNDAGLPRLAPLTRLRVLMLDHLWVSGEGLSALAPLVKKMQTLLIGSTAVSGRGLPRLASLGGLRELSLRRTGVDAAAVAALQERLPQARIVVADGADE